MIDAVGVVIPARNEQESITACLRAVHRAARRLQVRDRRFGRVRVIVVLDACIDATARIVAGHPDVEAIAVHAGSTGAARAAGARRLLARSSGPPSRLWIANTDADSEVPGEWLTRTITFADAGAQLVLGTVVPRPGQLPHGIEAAWHARHAGGDPHPHVHGANFGIRADTYLALGGWPDAATGEDVLLAARAEQAGLRIARTTSLAVVTSARTAGRSPRGFAHYLARLAQQQPRSPV